MDMPTYKLFLGDFEVHYNEAEAKAALFDAAKNDTSGIIEQLHDAVLDLDITDDDGKTALALAVENNSMDVLCELIAFGAKFQLDEIDGKAVLFHAAKKDFRWVVERLYYAGLDLGITDDDGKTTVAYAVENNSMDALCELIGFDAKFDLDEIDGKAVLFYAAKNDIDGTAHALHRAGLDLNITDDDGKTALALAVENNSMDALCELINLGAKFKLDEIDGRAVLFHAAKKDFSWVVLELSHAGLNLDITDDDGKTAVFYADDNKSMDALCELIECGANFKLDEIDGKAVLFHLVKNEDINMVKRLLREGILYNMTADDVIEFLGWFDDDKKRDVVYKSTLECDLQRRTVLFSAAKRNKCYEIRRLYDEGLDLDITDDDGKTAVFYANENKSMNALCELIDLDAEFELDEIDGKAVLFHAAKNDLFGVVESLHHAGLDLNITDDDGKTALFYANNQNYKDVVCELIKGNAHFVLDDIDGKAVLFHAAKNNEEDVVKPLHDAGLDLNQTDDKGKTAVFYANMKYSKDVLCELIECGADFDLNKIDGKAAMFCAVEQRMDVAVSKLLSAGLDVNLIDNQGKTAFFYAVQQSNNKSVVRTLIKAGIDVKITDNEGKTALFYAVDRDAVDALIEKDTCKALLNARDQYGRTALFYALEQDSMTTAHYLIEKGGNLYLKDKCGVNGFAFFIEKARALPSDVSELFQEQHQLNSLAAAVLDVIYCQAPLLSAKSFLLQKGYQYLYRIFDETYLLEALTFARTQGFTQDDDKRKAIDKIAFLITEDKVDVPSLLAWLNKLGANPDAADSDGNTALHYATLLPLYGVSQETVIDVCKKLKDLGSMFDVKNQQQQSPLLFCLSVDNWEVVKTNNPWHVGRGLIGVCSFLSSNGSSVNETSQSGESAFHLLMKFVHKLFNLQGLKQPDVLQELIDLLRLVSSKALERGKENIANKIDSHLNSPLHLWASLNLPSSTDYSSRLTEDHTFENILQLIRDILLECGAKLNPRNENEDTPLHLCKTWAAVKLLIDAGANPNDLNSSKRSPLLVAAKERTYLEKPGCFYPDVVDDPETFWKSALEGGLDPWTADKQGESVLSILIESEAFVLAKALIDVGIEQNHIQSETKLALLCIICKDKSTHTHWKTNLVEIILNSAIESRLPVDSALRLCCRNIVKYGVLDDEAAKNQKYVRETKKEPNDDDGQPPNKKRRKEEEKEESNDDLVTFDSVHCKLAKQLLWYGVDIRIRGSSGESCLDIAENCPALKDLLTNPIDDDNVPLLIPWTSVSNRYKTVMAKVARRQEYKVIDQISVWYHKDHIGSGAFGHIFAGINEKDGREVAIKRIERLRLRRAEDKREIQNLTLVADCQQVVRYVSFFEDQDFCYVVLELMEGNLEEYLNESTIDASEATRLCKDVVMGLKFLHEQNILHRDLKPQNILYKTHPKLCLKIADFGLSRRIDEGTMTSSLHGTRCWIAPEILRSPKNHSKSSDMFSCGLLLHYSLSGRKHPFSPADFANKFQVSNETEANILHNKMEGWDNSLSPEASHLVRKMIESTVENRPTAEEAIDHPLFWTKEKKINFLDAVGNQKEFECPRAKRGSMGPLTAVEKDLETNFGTIVKCGSWTDPGYLEMQAIYRGMTSGKGRKSYDKSSIVELVRFIRNVNEHFQEKRISTKVPIEDLLHKNFVFLEYFPALVMVVYKVVTTHGWDQTRDTVKYAMNK